MRAGSASGLATVLLCFATQQAAAQTALSVPMEVVRISNPDLAASSPGGVTLYRIQPQYTLQLNDGRVRTELSLGGVIERSSATSLSPHRTLPQVSVLREVSSPLAVLAMRAALEEASTRETEFAEQGRVTRDSNQRTATVGATWVREISERASVEMAASHSRVTFDTPLFADFNESRGSLAYRFELGARSRSWLTASAARLNPDGILDSSSQSGVTLRYQVDLADGAVVTGSAGAVRVNATRRETHPVGSLGINYEGERVGYNLTWARNIRSSLGSYSRTESVDANLSLPLTARTSLSFGIGHARSIGSDRDGGTSATSRIRSELTPFWALTAGFEHRQATRANNTSARGNVVSVGLSYTHPDF